MGRSIGSLVGYDDFWSYPCDTKRPNFNASREDLARSPLEEGEGLSHVEMARRFNASFICLAGSCRSEPECQAFSPVFMLVSVGGGSAEIGFHMSTREIGNWKLQDLVCTRKWNTTLLEQSTRPAAPRAHADPGRTKPWEGRPAATRGPHSDRVF